MRKVITGVFTGVMILALIGCGATAKTIKQKTQNERVGVFTEVKNADAPAQGFAVLNIKATIKTHLEGYYCLESKDSAHGKPGYPFLINIDGQAATWAVNGLKESVPLYDKDGKTSLDPEAGDGIKYILGKKIQLRPGTHKVFLVLPADDYFREVEITLKEGDSITLEFRPVYKFKTQPTRIPNFKKGIKEYEVYLNNTCINAGDTPNTCTK
ncbi:MAG: hypothetical protein CVU54_11670 [Deltaproteobacteria bacterium HGW-Deltaproteobacteria-12]|jgi:hypothetical protein|nr:MAG: hypothetical protein CVU54_11670 [Deltaproteobacteria bacterium HGW-Deltaproteobacteria-12]